MSPPKPRNARIFAVDNQLARLANAPGGRKVADAVRAADQRVESVRGASVAALGKKAEQLSAAAAACRAGGGNSFDGIYDISNAIYGVASTFQLKALAQAAFSLCDLADGFRGGEAVNWPAIDVHVDGIRLLVTLGDKAGAAGEEVLGGLRRVRDRVLGAAPGAAG
jgi:hypothetical protein